MMLKATAEMMDRILREETPGKYSYTVSESEKQELNIENGKFKLLRTVFGSGASARVLRSRSRSRNWPCRA